MRCRCSQPPPNVAASLGPASLSSSCLGQAGRGCLIAVRPQPPFPASAGVGPQGLLPYCPIWGSFLHCHSSSPSPQTHSGHTGLAAPQRYTMPYPRHWLEAHQGHGATPKHHPTGIRLERHLQKGFLVNKSSSLCTVMCLPQSLGTHILRLEMFCKPFPFIINRFLF